VALLTGPGTSSMQEAAIASTPTMINSKLPFSSTTELVSGQIPLSFVPVSSVSAWYLTRKRSSIIGGIPVFSTPQLMVRPRITFHSTASPDLPQISSC
jgi:hypothetical protein